jgi:hypothetical protein
MMMVTAAASAAIPVAMTSALTPAHTNLVESTQTQAPLMAHSITLSTPAKLAVTMTMTTAMTIAPT